MKDRADKKAEWLKKNKKKPKTEDEEQKDLEEMFEKVSQNLYSDLHSTFASEADKEVSLEKVKWLMDNHEKMDQDAYDALNRRKSIRDIEFAGKDVILRLDLDIPLSEYEAPVIEATDPKQ